MKTKVLPLLWYCTALVVFAGVLVIGKKLGFHPLLGVGGAWLASILASLLVGSAVLKFKSDLRFSTRQQVDGLGYVHQPMSVVVYMTLLALVCGAVLIFKR
jgi:hypothetical protein